MRALLFAALLTAALPTAVLADDAPGRVGVGVQGGSIGIGPTLGYQITDDLDVQLVEGALTANKTVTSDQTYAGTIHLGGAGGWFEYAPGGGAPRLAAGFLQNNATIHVHATTSGSSMQTVVVNGVAYQVSGMNNIGGVDGDIRFTGGAPYVGIGFGPGKHARRHGVAFVANAGVAFGPTPSTTLAAVNPGALPASQQATLQQNLAAEQLQVQQKVNFLQTFPVVTLGLQYHF
jgi:hypothetical protein